MSNGVDNLVTLVPSSANDMTFVCKGFDAEILGWLEAVESCSDPDARADFVKELRFVLALKIDSAFVVAVRGWNSPALTMFALLVYACDAAPNEASRALFRDKLVVWAVRAILEIFTRPVEEIRSLMEKSGDTFFKALQISGGSSLA